MQYARPAIVLFVVTFATALLLGSVNVLTLPKALEQQRLTLMKNLADTYPAADNFEEQPVSAEHIRNVYGAYIDSEKIGYVIVSEGSGYGGAVEVITGIDLTGVIVNVKMGEHSETPGLGTNAEKAEFTNQYINQTGKLRVVKRTAGANEIQALTSATITTEAITTGVNRAMAYYSNNLSGGEKP